MPPERPRVLYWNNVPAPYMVDRFNALADRGRLDLDVWFSRRDESDRSWKIDEKAWRFPGRYLPTLGRQPLPIGLLTPRRYDVLVSPYGESAYVAGWLLAKMRGMHTAFECERTFDSWVRRRPWKEAAKRLLFPRLDGLLVIGEDARAYALGYGARPHTLDLVPHGIDADHFARAAEAARPTRQALRDRLGVGGCVFAYVGRFWSGKGLLYLLDAFEEVSRSRSDVSLLLVGDGEQESELRAEVAARRLQGVVFTGFRQQDALPELLAAADVFVFPTLGDPYGLVVDEALASGLPVVSTSAAGEISARIQEGVNGFVVPPASSGALAERMGLLAEQADVRERMAAAARLSPRQTTDDWAAAFEAAIDRILRRSPVARSVREAA